MIQHTLTRLLPLGLILGTTVAQEAAPKPDTKPQELPEMVISSQKIGRDLLNAPISATVADLAFLEQAAIRNVKDAAIYAPNTFVNQFSARKLSNPYFRGVAGSPLNPGVTTFFDGGTSAQWQLLQPGAFGCGADRLHPRPPGCPFWKKHSRGSHQCHQPPSLSRQLWR